MQKELKWNKVILEAMAVCRYANIDKLFLACEDKFCELNAPEKEMSLRLYALAFYCDKIYHHEFSKTAAFTRFADILGIARFDRAIKRLIEKEDPALIVFWTIFRLSFENTIGQKRYLTLENKMRFSILPLL